MFFLGHSHVAAIEGAADRRALPYRSLNLWGFGRPVVYGDGPPRLDDELAAMLEGHELVLSTVGGSAADMLGLARHPHSFDLVLADSPDLPLIPEATVLPQGAVAAAIMGLMEDEQLDLVRALPARGRRVIHLESPPPPGDDPRLVAQLEEMPFVPRPSPGPSPALLRHKLWRLHSRVVRRACEAAGVAFAPAPKAALDGDGFLRPEFYERPGHANAAYGALVLAELGIVA